MLGSSSIIRRQHFLIRVLGCCSNNQTHPHQYRMICGSGLEADALGILRSITPALDPSRYKGQADQQQLISRMASAPKMNVCIFCHRWKIAVIGGCREYTGAPYFSAISALKIGADLSHVFCTKDAAPVIKSYSPELIVHPILEESYSDADLVEVTFRDDEDKRSISDDVLAEVVTWMERFDCLVVGPGLGRDPFLLMISALRQLRRRYLCLKDCVSNIMKHARQSNVPIVIDGDGLFLVTNCLNLVSGYPLAILTPNVNEYKRLVQKVLNCEVNDEDAPQQLLSLAKGIGGVTILRKGKSDLISDGETV
ncbi:unnamed protein product [Camellia sinensis]